MLAEGASAARVAGAHEANANQVFYWRKLYQPGRLGGSGAAQFAAGVRGPALLVDRNSRPRVKIEAISRR